MGSLPVIIIPAYSRPDALLRLLNSINNSVFPQRNIQLIISLDGGATDTVENVADSFRFKHGEKTVIKRESNLGLREHILWCGDQTETYGSVIILEDDLLVDKYFYLYTLQALRFYESDKEIAGISLYSQRINVISKLAFEPLYNGYSAYFIQSPSSWGQAWNSDQWSRFRDWYITADKHQVDNSENVPQTIKNWPETSWKKYFAAYMAESDTYFAYPYHSYTTNCADPGGVHMADGSPMYQVPLGAENRPQDKFSFCKPVESAAVYDTFFEPLSDEIYSVLELAPDELEIDFFGTKPVSLLKKKKYVLTSRKCSNPIRVFRYSFKPIEKTVLEPVNEPDSDRYGYTDHIYLAESCNINSSKRPFYQQVNYMSYYMLENRYVFRRYILFRVSTLINKFKNLLRK